jgi:hypothetical protein
MILHNQQRVLLAMEQLLRAALQVVITQQLLIQQSNLFKTFHCSNRTPTSAILSKIFIITSSKHPRDARKIFAGVKVNASLNNHNGIVIALQTMLTMTTSLIKTRKNASIHRSIEKLEMIMI